VRRFVAKRFGGEPYGAGTGAPAGFSTMIRPRFFVISFLSLLFTAAICGLVFWVLAKGEDTAREASTQFATALVKDDPSLAPKGGADHLESLRAQFGEVSGARVIETRNHRIGSGDDARTYYVSDLLLETARGAAVVELEFDSTQLISDTVTGVRELAPKEVKGLDDAELTAVAKAYVARGEEPAPKVTASTIAKVVTTPAATPTVSPEIRKAKRQLHCVQRARGDVEKLARCAS
jgi:hypothetical protein